MWNLRKGVVLFAYLVVYQEKKKKTTQTSKQKNEQQQQKKNNKQTRKNKPHNIFRGEHMKSSIQIIL